MPFRLKFLIIPFLLMFMCAVCYDMTFTFMIQDYLISPPTPAKKQAAYPVWSPNGQYIAYVCYVDGPIETLFRRDMEWENDAGLTPKSWYTEEAADICRVDAQGNNFQRLTNQVGAEHDPTWSPDSSQIAYFSESGLYVMKADGSDPKQLTPLEGEDLSWSPDGTKLLFAARDLQSYDIYLVEPTTSHLSNVTATTSTEEIKPFWVWGSQQILFVAVDVQPLDYGQIDYRLPRYLKTKVLQTGQEQSIHGGLYYDSVVASPQGQIYVVTDFISTNVKQYLNNYRAFDDYGIVYEMSLTNTKPISVANLVLFSYSNNFASSFSVSADGQYLVYSKEHWLDLTIQNLRTRQPEHLPLLKPAIETYFEPTLFGSYPERAVLSPDNRLLAIAVKLDLGDGFEESDEERHIVIIDIQTGTTHQLVQP